MYVTVCVPANIAVYLNPATARLCGPSGPSVKIARLRHKVKGINKQIPAADVVEVVRCKDCLWWDESWRPKSRPESAYCVTMDKFIGPSGFCSYGEGRDS